MNLSPEGPVSVRVLLPNAFQKHTNGTRELHSQAGNLPQLIAEIETQFPALKSHLRDESGQVRRFINFYVNEEDIRFLGNEKYAFRDGDEVLVIPSIAGGSFSSSEPIGYPTCVRRRAADTVGALCHCCSYCGQENCICGD